MLVSDIVKPGTRVFLKSEWGPVSDDWPAVSFSKQAVGRKIRSVYVPGRDFIVYVGTTNPANTPEVGHRSRLLSLASIDHRTEYKTWELVPPESWEYAQREYENRWLYSFAITSAWNFTTLPFAPHVVSRAYRELGSPPNFGSIVELDDIERSAILNEPVVPIVLQKQAVAIRGDARGRFLDADQALREEIYRMASRIEERATASGTTSLRHHPERSANPRVETQQMLYDKWEAQHGRCGLCQRPIPMPPQPGLLQASADRIDSTNSSYGKENVHITHLGCNLAKNQYSIDEFEDWLAIITAPVVAPRETQSESS
jgi:hypothetical protein